jgi:hypothetical protein
VGFAGALAIGLGAGLGTALGALLTGGFDSLPAGAAGFFAATFALGFAPAAFATTVVLALVLALVVFAFDTALTAGFFVAGRAALLAGVLLTVDLS